MLIIEEDRGTYYGSAHPHNGYYAGDFTGRAQRTGNELRTLTRIRPQHGVPGSPAGTSFNQGTSR